MCLVIPTTTNLISCKTSGAGNQSSKGLLAGVGLVFFLAVSLHPFFLPEEKIIKVN